MPKLHTSPAAGGKPVVLGLAERTQYERWFAPTPEALAAFCFEACKTVDQHDKLNPLKPLPDLDFIRFFFWLCCTYNFVNVPKSRQVFMTWCAFVYALWRMLAMPRQLIGLVPKKEEDGLDHIQNRLRRTLFGNLPPWLQSLYVVAEPKGELHLTHMWTPDGLVEWDSRIVAYAKGADQVRSFTHSLLIGDEVSFQPKHSEWFHAALATTQGRGEHEGQILQLSSATRDCFFHKQVHPAMVREAVRLAKLSDEQAA